MKPVLSSYSALLPCVLTGGRGRAGGLLSLVTSVLTLRLPLPHTLPLTAMLCDPGVPENLLERHPLLRVLPQEPPDQGPGLDGDMRREVEPDVDDVPVGVLFGLCLEGGLADQELVGEDAERPVVHPLTVGVTLKTWTCQDGIQKSSLVSPQSSPEAGSPVCRTWWLCGCWERALTTRSQRS